MSDPLINSLVVEYVTEVDAALGKKLSKKLQTAKVPAGSPNVKEVVEHFFKTGSPQRRMSLEPFASPAMKAKIPKVAAKTNGVSNGKTNGHSKKADSSSEESSSEDEAPKTPVVSKKTKKSPKVVRPTAPAQAQSSSDDSSSEEETAPVKAPAKSVAKPTKKESSSDDSSSEDEAPKKAAPVKKTPVKTAPAKKPAKESSSDDSSSEEESAPVKKPAPVKKAPVKKESSSDESSSEDEAVTVKKPVTAKVAAKKESSSEESSDESSEEEAKPAPKKVVAKAAKKESSSEDSSDDSSDEETAKPTAPVKVASQEESSSNSSEEEKPAPVVKSPTKKRARESDGGAEFGSQQKFVKADEGINGNESNELFALVGETQESDLYEYFGKYGDLERVKVATDRETGASRGFAFITYTSAASAKDALADGFECTVAGNRVSIRIAEKKRQSDGGDFGNRQKFSRNDEGVEDTNELFVQNVGSLSEDHLYSHFGKYGEVQRAKIAVDRETGDSRGFAFITFNSPEEAKKALSDGNEVEVEGQFIRMRMARNNPEQQEKVETSQLVPRVLQVPRRDGRREPFRRVRAEDFTVDPRFNNSYTAKKGAGSDWGHKAHQSLIVTRGKGFRHEKNKKKKGSYVGGTLNLSVNSIKFDD